MIFILLATSRTSNPCSLIAFLIFKPIALIFKFNAKLLYS
nr:MAG TPA: hypothetical protein [Caudoviricetes sp.]